MTLWYLPNCHNYTMIDYNKLRHIYNTSTPLKRAINLQGLKNKIYLYSMYNIYLIYYNLLKYTRKGYWVRKHFHWLLRIIILKQITINNKIKIKYHKL